MVGYKITTHKKVFFGGGANIIIDGEYTDNYDDIFLFHIRYVFGGHLIEASCRTTITL